VHQVGFSLHNYIEMHGQQNIKCMFICICTKYEDLNPDARAGTIMKCDTFTVFII
jgi:hypothetical protein